MESGRKPFGGAQFVRSLRNGVLGGLACVFGDWSWFRRPAGRSWQSGGGVDLRLAGVPAFTSVLDLPYLRKGVQTHQFTSYDRAGDNYDADYFPLYTEPDGACVLFDVYGPGCLYRLHANLWNGDLTGVNIRFQFDGEAKPRIDMDVTKFFSSENPLGIFKEPYAHIGDGYRFVYHPFFFKRHLKISLSKEPFGGASVWDKLPWLGRYDKHPYRRNHWYNFTYHTYTDDPGLQSWTAPADMSTVARAWDPSQIGKPPVAVSGAVQRSVNLAVDAHAVRQVFVLDRPGTITALRFRIDPADEPALFDTWLKIRFDGSTEPQVDVPLGCFFGMYRTHPDKRIASRFVGTIGSDMYCYLPMPFWRTATVELTNTGGVRIGHLQANLEVVPGSSLTYARQECGTFQAIYHREEPRTEGHDYRYADITGAGHIVGHFTFRTNTSMEEDERTYFDQSQTPSIYGEGFEDDHNQGWGLHDLRQAIYGSVGSDGGSGAPWRFFIPDLYVFHSGVQHGHQVYGPHSPLGHEGMYQVGAEESVTFLYALPGPDLTASDTLQIGSPASERAHGYHPLGTRKNRVGSWWYDGEENNVLFKLPAITANGVSSSRGSEFRVRINPSNAGVRLVRRTDKENNRQLANVYVDGHLVRERKWFSVDFERTFRDIRWFDSAFEIPAKYTKGKSAITVRIELISSKTGWWDEFGYTAYSYR